MSRRFSGIRPVAEDLLRVQPLNIVLAGPPGSGKSAVGRRLGERLRREFVDTDAIVEQIGGKSIPQIFAEDGESAFRRMERQVCRQVAEPAGRVIACGGGALLDEGNRTSLEAGGSLVCLTGQPAALLARLRGDGSRPLLAGDDAAAHLHRLLAQRRDAYDSIPVQLDTTGLTIDEVADRIAHLPLARQQARLVAQRPGPGYEVVLGEGLLSNLETWLEQACLSPPFLVISDTNVAPLYGKRIQATLGCTTVAVPAGEKHKSHEALVQLYAACVQTGMDRSGTVVALGGGVLLDLAGFMAATFMRGVRWAALPTSLLAMVDAGLGGKVGIDFHTYKNLIGAFHPPSIVLADLNALTSLPQVEARSGMAEIVKAALIGDAVLFNRMEWGPRWLTQDWLLRAMRVKLAIVDEDPFERGRRALLNLGHTFAHALEAASGYTLPHGQAVAVGLVAAARLARAMDFCQADLPDRVERVLLGFGLPVDCAGLDTEQILAAMEQDKKRRMGRLRFVLPVYPGRAEFGVEAPASLVREIVDRLRRIA